MLLYSNSRQSIGVQAGPDLVPMGQEACTKTKLTYLVWSWCRLVQHL